MAKKAAPKRTTAPKTEPKDKVVSTVQDPEVIEVVEKEKKWEMPQPCRGQTVLFYYRSTVNKRNTDVAFVTKTGNSMIGVAFRGNGYNEVLHVDDPRLKDNSEIRQDIDGLWDWTQEKKDMDSMLTTMNERIARLEEKLNL